MTNLDQLLKHIDALRDGEDSNVTIPTVIAGFNELTSQNNLEKLEAIKLTYKLIVLPFQTWTNFDYNKVLAYALGRGILPVLLDIPPHRKRALRGLSAANFREVVYREVPLWEVAKMEICQHFHKRACDVDASEPSALAHIGNFYSLAIDSIDHAILYIKTFAPSAVVFGNGYHRLPAALRCIAIREDLPLLGFEKPFDKDRLIWDNVSGLPVNKNLTANYFWRHEGLVDKKSSAKLVGAYLSGVKKKKTWGHISPVKKYNIETDGAKIIFYIGQVSLDTSIIFGLRGFPSQKDVIKHVTSFAIEQGYRLFIKLHPRESAGDAGERRHRTTQKALNADAEFQDMLREHSHLVTLDADNTYDTYHLIGQADCCVTISSQAGLESLLMGKEVVVCGDTFYGGLGMTHEAQTPAGLSLALTDALEGKKRADPERVAEFFYIFTNHYCIQRSESAFIDLCARQIPGVLDGNTAP